jgi:hypothetical protein
VALFPEKETFFRKIHEGYFKAFRNLILLSLNTHFIINISENEDIDRCRQEIDRISYPPGPPNRFVEDKHLRAQK